MSRKKGPRFVPVEDVPGPGLGPRGRELIALCIVGLAVFALLALATFQPAPIDGAIPRGGLTNLGGTVGYGIAFGLTYTLGFAAFVPCFGAVIYGLLLFVGRPVDRLVLKTLGIVVFAAMLALLFAGPFGDAAPSRLAPQGPGGAFGANLSPKLLRAFGGSGRVLLLLFGAACSFVLATEWLLSTAVLRFGELVEAGAPPARWAVRAARDRGGCAGGATTRRTASRARAAVALRARRAAHRLAADRRRVAALG